MGSKNIENNPVRAGLATTANDYLWSSPAAHCGLGTDTLLSALPAESDSLTPANSHGCSKGSPEFLTLLESTLERAVMS